MHTREIAAIFLLTSLCIDVRCNNLCTVQCSAGSILSGNSCVTVRAASTHPELHRSLSALAGFDNLLQPSPDSIKVVAVDSSQCLPENGCIWCGRSCSAACQVECGTLKSQNKCTQYRTCKWCESVVCVMSTDTCPPLLNKCFRLKLHAQQAAYKYEFAIDRNAQPGLSSSIAAPRLNAHAAGALEIINGMVGEPIVGTVSRILALLDLAVSAAQISCSNESACEWCNGQCVPKDQSFCTACAAHNTSDRCRSPSCNWCNTTGVCISEPTCPASCLSLDLVNCSAAGKCLWNEDLGVCFDAANATEYLPVSSCNAVVSSAVCNASHACRWCDQLGYCRDSDDDCVTMCTGLSDRTTCSTARACKWCPALWYCASREAPCASRCRHLTARPQEECAAAAPLCRPCSGRTDVKNISWCQDAFAIDASRSVLVHRACVVSLTRSTSFNRNTISSSQVVTNTLSAGTFSLPAHSRTETGSDPLASASLTVMLTASPSRTVSSTGWRYTHATHTLSAATVSHSDTQRITGNTLAGTATVTSSTTRRATNDSHSISHMSVTADRTATLLVTISTSPSATVLLPLLPVVVPLVVAASQAVVASVSLATSFVAAGAAASASLQATLSSSQCSAAALANAGGDDDPMLAASRNPSMYLVSPFVFSRSSYAMIAGNVALVLLAAAVHWWAVAFAGRSDLDPASTLVRRSVEWRFPNFTMIFAKLMMQGVVLGGWQLLWAALVGDNRQGSAVLCVVAALASFCVSFALPWWVLRVRRDLMACDGASRYSRGVPLEAVQIDYGLFARTGRIVRACGPTVFWTPRAHRLMLGSAFNDYGVAGVCVQAWYWMSGWVLPMVVSAASAARPPASARAALCNTLMLLVFAVMLAYAAAVAVLAPYRLRCKNPLQGVISVWLGLTCLLSCPLTNTHLGAERVAVALGVVGVLQSVTILTLAVFELLSFVHVDVLMSQHTLSHGASSDKSSSVSDSLDFASELDCAELENERSAGADACCLNSSAVNMVDISVLLETNLCGTSLVVTDHAATCVDEQPTAVPLQCADMFRVSEDQRRLHTRAECERDFSELLSRHMDVVVQSEI